MIPTEATMSINCEKLKSGSHPTPATCPAWGGTVLLVEDEASVRNLVTRFLSLNGFTVLAATQGREALAIWDERKSEIDLLLTDMVMPGEWSGRQLAGHFRMERPALKVLFTSGYSVDTFDAAEPGGEIHFVQKPYRPDQLLSAVRALLAEKAETQLEILC